MKQTQQLTAPQLACLRVVWERGEATAAEVHRAIARRGRPAYTTVATVLARLEKQGLVDHREDGRTHVFRALVGEEEAKRGMARELKERAFAGDAAELVAHLVEAGGLRAGDLRRMRALIEAAEKKRKGGPR